MSESITLNDNILTDWLENHLLYKSESYRIIGAAMTVHRELGSGFLEAVYQEALEIEFGSLKIPYEAQVPLNVTYKGNPLKKQYLADFVCFGKIIVEIKALSGLTAEHEAQVLNYLKASGFKLGLLINFGEESLFFQRLIKEN
ncbi:MAG TPA: GxxExxY protein [Prolixibacteraceae bacterium]|nr:GxxExxY protein [Prolixibacteraceae bacterium]HOC87090.1 GxxExxY protein [Prolixibacteraceae bacterium]HOG96588.1 GxxExxY protein [Prolixibacteraceae bacterium]HQB27354.1 GxxExxY protein [Paludibacter sp.]